MVNYERVDDDDDIEKSNTICIGNNDRTHNLLLLCNIMYSRDDRFGNKTNNKNGHYDNNNNNNDNIVNDIIMTND